MSEDDIQLPINDGTDSGDATTESDGRRPARTSSDGAFTTDEIERNPGRSAERMRLQSVLDEAGIDESDLDSDETERLLAILDAVGVDGTDGDLAAGGGVMDALDPFGLGGNLTDLPTIARIVVGALQQVTEYSIRAQVRTTRRVARAATTSQSPEELLSATLVIAEDELQRLGVDIDDFRGGETGNQHAGPDNGVVTEEALRERGTQILQQSADVTYDESVHPAYANILDELAADEARILRLLATEGPQPSVDIRDSGFFPLTSTVVAAGLSMIGIEAGCSHEERTTAYLNNLRRLGLVWFADEPLDELKRYQVLEAQPDVMEAMEEARRPKPDRRSIHLTPFGVDFCGTCLPVDVDEEAAGAFEIPDDAE